MLLVFTGLPALSAAAGQKTEFALSLNSGWSNGLLCAAGGVCGRVIMGFVDNQSFIKLKHENNKDPLLGIYDFAGSLNAFFGCRNLHEQPQGR